MSRRRSERDLRRLLGRRADDAEARSELSAEDVLRAARSTQPAPRRWPVLAAGSATAAIVVGVAVWIGTAGDDPQPAPPAPPAHSGTTHAPTTPPTEESPTQPPIDESPTPPTRTETPPSQHPSDAPNPLPSTTVPPGAPEAAPTTCPAADEVDSSADQPGADPAPTRALPSPACAPTVDQ